MSFERVLSEEELWDGEATAVAIDGKALLLVRTADVVRAYANRCPHRGVSLSEGRLDRGVLTCAAHRWEFSALTGEGLNPRSCQLTSYPVEVRSGVIFVDVSRPSTSKSMRAKERCS